MAVKGASLLPSDFAAGGAIPDGDYTITGSRATKFNYGGKGPDTPALAITFVDEDGEERSQNYSAGKPEFLVASEDGKRFVHPGGDEARIGKQSNAAAFIGSIIGGGFPVEKLSDDVSVFEGTKVTIRNEAQPTRAGLKDQKEGKTIPLVTKVLSLPGEKGRPTSAAAAGSRRATPTPTTAASPASATQSQNGQLDEAAVTAVQESLAEAADNTMTRLKLGTSIMLRLSKAKNPDMSAIKKLSSDAAWLSAHAEEGGWTFENDVVKLG